MKPHRACLLVAAGLLSAAASSPASAGAGSRCWPQGQSSDTAEIAGVLARYGQYADARDDARFADLFTDDGVWEAEAFGRMTGTEALKRFIKGIPGGSRHVTANYVIDVSGSTATARSYVMMLGMEAGRPVVRGTGTYEDTLVRIGCAWKFKTRKYLAWKPDSAAK